MSVQQLTKHSLLLTLLIICSWIHIPSIVPFTLQTFLLFLLPLIIPMRFVFYILIAYLLLGMLGFPVFANFQGGLQSLFGLTGGYLIGFVFSMLFLALTQRLWKHHMKRYVFFACISLCICYLFGSLWFFYIYNQTRTISMFFVLSTCVFPFIIPDILKILLATYIQTYLSKLNII